MTIIDWLIAILCLTVIGAMFGLLAWCLWFAITWIIAFINFLIDVLTPDADEDTGGPI